MLHNFITLSDEITQKLRCTTLYATSTLIIHIHLNVCICIYLFVYSLYRASLDKLSYQFPLKSTELIPGSPQYNEYISVIDKVGGCCVVCNVWV